MNVRTIGPVLACFLALFLFACTQTPSQAESRTPIPSIAVPVESCDAVCEDACEDVTQDSCSFESQESCEHVCVPSCEHGELNADVQACQPDVAAQLYRIK
jgi:hypothetical protein